MTPEHVTSCLILTSIPNNTGTLQKCLYGNKVKSGIPSINDGNEVFATSEARANLFNDHFAAKSCLTDNLPELPNFTYVTDARLNEVIADEKEVLDIMKGLDVSKANGPDNIGNKILKMIAQNIAVPLTKLFNFSLSSGKFPDQWKQAHVTPVHKKNDRQDKNNYRPISLLPNLGKILERLVFKHLYKYCIDNNLLTWRNSGYKPLDSTVNQLILLCHRIYEALEKGQDICFVSLDASSAFNRVWHKGLIFKLKQLGISGKLLIWLEDYLSNRKQRVVIGGKKSEWTDIKAGVPQGSILGPLLFLIYVNDIINDIESEILLFADDTSMYEPILDPNISIPKVNRDLNRLGSWSMQWLVNFNPLKTKYMIISKKLHKQNYPPLFLNGTQLDKVNKHTQLGITFNDKLTWDDHIRDKCSTASKRLTLLKRLGSKVPRETRLTIYISFIRPVLEYGSCLFDNCSDLLSQMLEDVQRQAALTITQAYRNTSHKSLLKELGLDTLSQRRAKSKLILFYKMRIGLTPEYLQALIPAGEPVRYNTRGTGYIKLPKITKNYFLKSFLPSSVKMWNKLSLDIRQIADLDEYRKAISKIYTPGELYKPFLFGTDKGYIHLSRIRMGLSGLNAHRKRYHFIEHSNCPNCNSRLEDAKHFLFECPAYAAPRAEMITRLQAIIPQHNDKLNHLEIHANRKVLEKILVSGTMLVDIDKILFHSVSIFISKTKRLL